MIAPVLQSFRNLLRKGVYDHLRLRATNLRCDDAAAPGTSAHRVRRDIISVCVSAHFKPVIPRKETMPTDVVMPQMGESIFEGTITKWLKQPGDKVQRDEPLFEISTDKVDAEIPAPASGTLQEIKVQAGATVQVNTVVGTIAGEGEARRRGACPCSRAGSPEGSRSASTCCRSATSPRTKGARARARARERRPGQCALQPAGAQDRQGEQRQTWRRFPAPDSVAASPRRTSRLHRQARRRASRRCACTCSAPPAAPR